MRPCAARRLARRWARERFSRELDSAQRPLDGVTREIATILSRPIESKGDLIYHPDENDLPEGNSGTVYLRATTPIPEAEADTGECFATSGDVAYSMMRRNIAVRVSEADAQAWTDAAQAAREQASARAREGTRRRRALIRRLNMIRRAYRRLHGPCDPPQRLPAWISGNGAPAPQQDRGPADPIGHGPEAELPGVDCAEIALTTARMISNPWTRFVSVGSPDFVLRQDHDGLMFPIRPPEMVAADCWFGYTLWDRTPAPKGRPTVVHDLSPLNFPGWFLCILPCDNGTLWCVQRWGAWWPVSLPRDQAHTCCGFIGEGEPVPLWHPGINREAA